MSLQVRPARAALASGGLTHALLAGVGQVVVAGHVAPLAPVVPHHHRTVLPRQEVAVGLAFEPVLIELGEERLTVSSVCVPRGSDGGVTEVKI